MNWKKQLEDIEEAKEWKLAIDLVQKTIKENPNDMEAYVRGIYLLHNILLEEEYPEEEHDFMANLLKLYFVESYQKFSNDAEYSFFLGKISHIAEWYFGLDDGLNPMEQRLAFKMQKWASEKEPNNSLYEWAYVFSKSDKQRAFSLSKQLLYDEPDRINWLKSKGFPGKYVINSIKWCYDEYKKELE